MDPINYNIDVPNPTQSFMGGLQAGAGTIQTQQNQRLMQQQIDLQAALQKISVNPTPDQIAQLSVRFPQLSEQFKRSYDMLNQEQQQGRQQAAIPVYAAVLSGKHDVAADLLNQRATALENSGQAQEAAQTRTMAQLVKHHPETAKLTMGTLLASTMGADKFSGTFQQLFEQNRAEQKQPAEVATGQATATLKGVEAANATTKTELENQNLVQDAATKEFNRKIAALDTQIKQAGSETQRGQLQLERDKLTYEQNLKMQDLQNKNQDTMDTLSQSIETVNTIFNHPGLSKGTGVGGSVLSFFNGTDGADFRKMVDVLKSQQFSVAIKQMVGLGSLSDAEGSRIEKTVATLDPNQSTKQFKESLGIIKTNLEKGQAKLVARGKLPTNTGAFVMRHPVYGNVTDGDINRLMGQFPGSTREQVLAYLKQTGGK